ncbi:MAG: preprotein translocase subunit SecE [Rikenellaceae bacterium]|nr:preprotein translocase subunit SecE [Rikenellaceae bacterium]
MKLIQYVKDSYRELVDKVTWPTVPQLRNSAIVVMVASLLFAVVIVAMDQSFENIMKAIYGLLYTSAN